MKSKEIRDVFLNFFEKKQHKIVPSAPMVMKNDPTLMFVNAGMNPFKEFFLGQSKAKDKRVSDSQKCLRVSGKHNDLEEVGIDTYHHTMFEMLGNWSFGDYFKKEAINWAWELLTEVYKIDKGSLYVTVFEGHKGDNLDLDTESYDLWKELIPEDRILMGNKKDNFWEMGAQGPCGPCSEIHVDIRSDEEKAKTPGKDLVNEDHPQVVEIWNLVFMQFNRKANGSLEDLPEKHVDTGMGFERLAMVMQGVQSNYDTDVFTPMISKVADLAKVEYGKNLEIDIAIRVIVDHVRAVAFTIGDGQLPSNNGAGYVIRRILRRAVRYAFTFLDIKEPFIYTLVDILSEQMGDNFPEIRSQKTLIMNVIREEEASFLRTLDQGLSLLDNIISESKDKTVSGEKAFELYDTFGFPIDLTALILSEKGFELDEEGFKKELAKQKARSRDAAQIDTDDWVELIKDPIEEFIGYDYAKADIKITKYRKVVSKKDGELYQLVFNMTPFYPEGGGQVGDTGYIKGENDESITIINTKKENNLILHFSKKLPKTVEQKFTAFVDENKRKNTARNHTATHLLHEALREVLGTHVEQKGSLVNSKYLRFDFSHFAKLTQEELDKVSDYVNQNIEKNLALEEFRNIPMSEAIDKGAMALFGEKYGDTVRAIKFGDSVELCGGIHVKNTASIWQFKIKSEAGIAAGIRRIEAITGDEVKAFYTKQSGVISDINAKLKNSKDPVKSIANLQSENSELKKQIDLLLKEKAKQVEVELKNKITSHNGIDFIVTELSLDSESIKNMSLSLTKDNSNLFLFIASQDKGKVILTCAIAKELVTKNELNAGTIVREMGKLVQGGGGGQPSFATAGGKNPAGIPDALSKVMEYLG
ncbi:MAG: alanine--tRNA ligase [Flavobacteriaceae bacterium]|nr:alanine--tRNA ligase [Flavobacteriaceae bacterium]